MNIVKCKLINRLTGLICCLCIVLGTLSYNIPAKAATTAELVYSGTYNYDSAFECLQIVNKERAAQGLSPLKMDQGLLDTAMQRAGEISIYFSHTRPDGSDCFSIFPRVVGSYGENIAANSSTNAQGIMNQWMNSPDHKANILTADYTSIGIGCFTQGGVVFWVQCFGSNTATTAANPSKKTMVRSTAVSDERLAADMFQFRSSSYDMTAGDTKTLEVRIINQRWKYAVCELEPSSFNWTSSDASVVQVDSKGNATGRRAGTATITAKLKNAPYTAIQTTIKVAGPSTVYNGIDYSAVYDYYYYINKYSDVKNAFGGDANKTLSHFVNYGMKEGRQGCESFNVTSYKNRYADLRNAYGNDLTKYYMHYINYGKREGRIATGDVTPTTPQQPTAQTNVTVYNGVDYSAVYNYDYYIAKYPDVKNAYKGDKAATLKHFVNYGMKEGRQGSADFEVMSYANRYGDLRRAYKNNLPAYYTHYMKYGKREGRKATGNTARLGASTVYNGVDYSAVFDCNYYVNKYSDIKKAYNLDDEAILKHFINCGMKEGRQAKAIFNVQNYKNRYADLQKAYGSNLKNYYMHYIRYGEREGRNGK